MKKLIPALLLILSACYSAPKETDFSNHREYEMSKDKAWERVVEFFAERNLSIRTIEKDSGIIYAEPAIFNGNYADCGSFGAYKATDDVEGIVRLNVFVRTTNSGQTKVTVNSSFNDIFYNDPFIYGRKKVECESTGVLEKEILDFVGK